MAHQHSVGTDGPPDLTRVDVDLLAVSALSVADRREQRRLSKDLIDSWTQRPWPPGLRSVTCFTSTGQVTDPGLLAGARPTSGTHEQLRVLAIEQWSTEQDHDRFRDTSPVTPAAAGSTAMPLGTPVPYRLHKSYQNAHRLGHRASTIVVVTIDFDGPDHHRQRQWIDLVLEALDSDPAQASTGLIAAHFHTSLDGTRVINYAEWTSEEAYDDALANGPDGIGQTAVPQWQAARSYPGITANEVTRYTPYRGLQTPST